MGITLMKVVAVMGVVKENCLARPQMRYNKAWIICHMEHTTLLEVGEGEPGMF